MPRTWFARSLQFRLSRMHKTVRKMINIYHRCVGDILEMLLKANALLCVENGPTPWRTPTKKPPNTACELASNTHLILIGSTHCFAAAKTIYICIGIDKFQNDWNYFLRLVQNGTADDYHIEHIRRLQHVVIHLTHFTAPITQLSQQTHLVWLV